MQPSSKSEKLARAKFPCHGCCRMQGNPCLSYPLLLRARTSAEILCCCPLTVLRIIRMSFCGEGVLAVVDPVIPIIVGI
jgi:hypothetical protein